jgi:glycerophosphoryl diester phosphodiesterase
VSAPEPSRFPFLDREGIIAFAHRGGTTRAPENTAASFEHAWSLGYRYLETDVHRSADGVLVAFHDLGLSRWTGDGRTIAQMTWEELSQVRLEFTDADGRVGHHPIPTMDQLFEEFPDANWNIDPKADDAVEPLADAITRHAAIDRVCVGAFSDARVKRMRHLLGPRLCTSPGPRGILSALLPWPLPRSQPCVNIPTEMGSLRLNRAIVKRFATQGYRVHVWTVNRSEQMHRMIDLGVDGIMTDECELLRAVLQERGRWIV